MLLHLPIVENRIAQFAARFEPHGQGWVWYARDGAGGLPVSAAEHAALLAEHERLLRRSERVMWWWLPVAVLGCLAFELRFGTGDGPDPWRSALVFLLPMPWVIREWWRAERLPLELAGRRIAVTGPRGRWAGTRARLAAIPPGVPVMLLLICALLAVQSRPWATGTQRLWLAEAVAGIAIAAAMLLARRRAR